jgi:predicted membrane protein
MRRSGSLWIGVVLIILGVLLLLDNMYVVDFWDVLWTYWPLLLIFLGLSKIWGRSIAPRQSTMNSPGEVKGATATVYPTSEANYLSVSTVFGNYTVAVQSRSFAGGIVSTTFGDNDIDMLNGELAEGDHTLKLDGVFGSAGIQLPKSMPFAVYANTTFGAINILDQRKEGFSSSLDYTSPDFHLAKKRIRVSISRVFGNITVRQ